MPVLNGIESEILSDIYWTSVAEGELFKYVLLLYIQGHRIGRPGRSTGPEGGRTDWLIVRVPQACTDSTSSIVHVSTHSPVGARRSMSSLLVEPIRREVYLPGICRCCYESRHDPILSAAQPDNVNLPIRLWLPSLREFHSFGSCRQ